MKNKEYLNFDLKIGEKSNDLYPVSVINSPVGEKSTLVSFPLEDPKFQKRLGGIDKIRGLHGASNTRKTSNNPKIDSTRAIRLPLLDGDENKTVEKIGIILFQKLFDAESEIRSLYRRSLEKAKGEKKGLRIRIRIEAADLACLPWEYLYDQDLGTHICLSNKTPLIRYLELTQSSEVLTIEPPLKILGMIASPNDLPPLNVEKEKADMLKAVDHLRGKAVIDICWVEGQTLDDLESALDKGPWHMLHFIGHGGFNPDTKEGGIALVQEDGSSHFLTASNLALLLEDYESLRIVILNSCEGARSSKTDLFSSAGANLIRKGIPAVISMQYEITDKAALEFSREFYKWIGQGIPLEEALRLARRRIKFANDKTTEWGTPVLHMRAPSGNLFNIEDSIRLASYQTNSQEIKPIKPLLSQSTLSLETLKKSLNDLKKKVKHSWIEGFLKPSLQHSGLIDLVKLHEPTEVESPFGRIPIEVNESLGGMFHKIGRSMLVLGDPGSGKTILLLSMVEELLDTYEKQPDFDLPVVFKLSSWAFYDKSFTDWLIDELSMKYKIPVPVAKPILKNSNLLLMLDGLDEIEDPERRNECVKAINDYIKKQPNTGVAVCCRYKEYVELGEKLILNGAIRVKGFSEEKIMNHLVQAGPAFDELREFLARDSSFLELAEFPFNLNLMMRTFPDVSIEDMITSEFKSVKESNKQLMAAFVANRHASQNKKLSKA
ncbi:MAG: CHAT domain-containing protein [Bacteroidia bacterium]|nr:CHAT domain-containing protein [Bacteroidia bacterium]